MYVCKYALFYTIVEYFFKYIKCFNLKINYKCLLQNTMQFPIYIVMYIFYRIFFIDLLFAYFNTIKARVELSQLQKKKVFIISMWYTCILNFRKYSNEQCDV